MSPQILFLAAIIQVASPRLFQTDQTPVQPAQIGAAVVASPTPPNIAGDVEAVVEQEKIKEALAAEKLEKCLDGTAVKMCECISRKRKDTCKKGEVCNTLKGLCTNPLDLMIPVRNGAPCPVEALALTEESIRADPGYATTDVNGNCKCPPDFWCVSREVTNQLQDIRDEERGVVSTEKAVDKVLDAGAADIVGCPARDPDHVHWITSRDKFSWRVNSALCKPIERPKRVVVPPKPAWQLGLDETQAMIAYISAGSVIVLLAICLFCVKKRKKPSDDRKDKV